MATRFQSFVNRSLKQYKEKAKNIVSTKPSTISSMGEDDDAFEDCGDVETTPLSALADAFEELSGLIKSKGCDSDLQLKHFCDACSPVAVLFGCLGLAFKFAEMEYVSKVRNLDEASASYGTLKDILDFDVKNDSVKTQGSHSRNLRRVRQGLDLVRAIFENFLSSNEISLKDAASTAYAEVYAPYHTWAIRTAVYAGMCTLPSREQLVIILHETDESAQKEMRRYIDASVPVIEYIDQLYLSRDITLDW